MGPMPMGAPTAGFAPQGMPPHMGGMAGQYGMPITGTPIGLPGPPHIPLGVPAGLQRHTMVNRTRMLMPPPTQAVDICVKQRPGMNYPAPVDKVTIDETNRAPFRPLHGTVPGLIPSTIHKMGAMHTGQGDCQCDECRRY